MTEFKTLPAISNSITHVIVKHFYGVAECVLSPKVSLHCHKLDHGCLTHKSQAEVLFPDNSHHYQS